MIRITSRTVVNGGDEERPPMATRTKKINGVLGTAGGLLLIYTGYRFVKYMFDKKEKKNVDDYILEME